MKMRLGKGIRIYFYTLSVLLVAFSFLAHSWQCARSNYPKNLSSVLTYQLESKESFRLDEPATIRFTVRDGGDKALYVLMWYTPLEGMKGEIFKVLRDNEELPYEGRMVKRGDPRAEDYIRIEPQDSASATVDLSLGFDVSKPGNYRVEFIKKIYDVIVAEDVDKNKEVFPRPKEKHREEEISGNTLVFQIVE